MLRFEVEAFLPPEGYILERICVVLSRAIVLFLAYYCLPVLPAVLVEKASSAALLTEILAFRDCAARHVAFMPVQGQTRFDCHRAWP
jgi:hypothetical protein